jgi:hypothetical protein
MSNKRSIPKGGAVRENPEAGTHNAVCVQIIDLGTQASQNPEFKDARKVQFAFELVDEQTSDGKAMVVYKEYNYTDSPKSDLMKDLKAWMKIDGGDFDIEECLGKPCTVNVEIKTSKTSNKEYPKVTSVTGLVKGVKVKKATEDLKFLFLDNSFNQDTFDSLPEFLKTKISTSPEYEAAMAPALKKPAKAVATAKTAKKK